MSIETGPISPVRLIQILQGLGIPINAQLAAILAQLNVALSTRASEATIVALLAQLVAISAQLSTPTAIIEGQVTLTGVAQQLPNEPCVSVTLENPSANAVVCIGHDNSVTLANGYRLQPGATVSMDIDNANRVWVIGTVTQVISYIGVI